MLPPGRLASDCWKGDRRNQPVEVLASESLASPIQTACQVKDQWGSSDFLSYEVKGSYKNPVFKP